MTLSRAAVAALVRRSVPGLPVDGGGGGRIVFRIAAHAPGMERKPLDCRALIGPVARGAAITSTDVRPAPCLGTSAAPIRFDRAGRRLTAARDLPAGADLGRLRVPEPSLVDAGTALTLVSTEGVVQVRRAVTALQSATGRRVFVRDADGHVFAARLALSGATR